MNDVSRVKVMWTIRAAGRDEGDVETVELTPFVEALIQQKRVKILERIEPPSVEPGAEGLVVPLEKPKPRRPRKESSFVTWDEVKARRDAKEASEHVQE